MNPGQVHSVVGSAITTAIAERGPTVISIPGDVASADAPPGARYVPRPAATLGSASAADLEAIAALVNEATTVAIFGGDGCREAQAEVRALSQKLAAPVGYSIKGKQWLEHDNPSAVGMNGLLGYGGCWEAINHAHALLCWAPTSPSRTSSRTRTSRSFRSTVTLVTSAGRVPLELSVVGDVKATLTALAPLVEEKADDKFLRSHVDKTERANKRLQHYVTRGPRIKPIRPEYVAAVLDELADDDALFFADTGTPCIWAARHIHYGPRRRLFGSFTWASMASASPNAFGAQLAFPGRQTIALCGDGGFTMLAMGDLLTEVERKAPVIHIVFNNAMLDFVNIEQQEAGFTPFGTEFVNPDFGRVAEACGARGIRIEEPGDVRQGLQAALGYRDGPVVVDVLVDRYALSLPSHVPAETLKGFTLSLAKQALTGKMDDVIETVEHNVRLV